MKTTRELQPRERACANDHHDHLNNYAGENQIENSEVEQLSNASQYVFQKYATQIDY